MKLTVDYSSNEVLLETKDGREKLPLYSDRAFELISAAWLKVGWNQKYSYMFTWLGRPIIQLPDDIIRIQELIFRLRPDVIIETGVAHGGSLILYASIAELLGRGRVIGIDIEIKPENRSEIERHPLSRRIHLIEGSSTDDKIVHAVREQIRPAESVLVLLDSNHSYDHVRRELDLYSPLVSKDCYLVATDGIMQDLSDTPRGRLDWQKDNPARAARDFAADNPDFVLETPQRLFCENTLNFDVTYWPTAWLRRIR